MIPRVPYEPGDLALDLPPLVQSVAKFDPRQPRHPAGSSRGGEFAASGAMSAPILKGVDSKANAAVMKARFTDYNKGLGIPNDPAKVTAAEAEFRSLPLVHGTTIHGAVAAATEGLKSHREMQKAAKELLAEGEELRQEIVEEWEGAGGFESWERLSVEEIRQATDLNQSDAESLAEKIEELASIEQVVAGTTYPEDKKEGLDQFVFMTHGKKHQDYGNIAVIIDNEVMQQGWASERDINSTPGVTVHRPEEGLKNASYRGVENYKETITIGDDYYAVAAAKAGKPEGIIHRGREQLFEIKAPSVPKSAVKGFLVEDDLDTAQRLADKLASYGLKNRVLYVEYSKDSADFVHRQMKLIQETGGWDDDALDEYKKHHEGAYIL